MRKSVFLVLLTGLVLAANSGGPALAQLECTDPNLVALVFENEDINFNPPPFQPYYVQIRLLNPTDPDAGLNAFEFHLDVPPGHLLLDSELPPYALNIGTPPDYIVGLGDCLPPVNGDFLLCTLTFLQVDETPGNFFLTPAISASIPGQMAYQNCTGPPLIPMYPLSGDHQLPVAQVNGPPLDYCDPLAELDLSVNIVFDGDLDNVAGTASDATDGFDVAYDLADTDTTLTFPHPEWNQPGAIHFKSDIKAVYDPTAEMKQWTFVATAYNPQSGSQLVPMNFSPNFATPAPFDFLIRDRSDGSLTNLNSTLIYSFFIPPGHSQTTFDLMIGNDTAQPGTFFVDVNATGGGYSDMNNRAGTLDAATDGYDPAIDIPEPGPPPANYLIASFRQPGWPLGPRFTSDIKSVYDPLAEAKTWPVMVESDQSGSVTLTFEPSFTAADNYGLHLQDLQSGQTFDLFPHLSYVFPTYGPGTYHFLLTVGVSGAPVLNPTSRDLDPGWSLIGMPLIPPLGQDSFDQVILSQAPGFAYPFEYLGPSGYALLEGSDAAVTGTGNWIATDTGFNWTMTGERALDGVEIPLSLGWNLVGNPLWFPAPFEGLEVRVGNLEISWQDAISMGLVSMGVLGYDNLTGDYFNAIDLRPWNGYWINAMVPGVSLWFDWPNFQVLPLRLTALKVDIPVDDFAWETGLTLTDAEGGQRTIVMGVNSAATTGFDPHFDMPQPPLSPNGSSRLAFTRPEWNLAAGDYFSRDILPVSPEGVCWNVIVSTTTPGQVTLSWDSSGWPEDQDFQIYLPQDNRVVVMSMRGEDHLRLDVGAAAVPLVIRTPDMISGTEDMPGMDFAVGVHPNPFNPSTTIHFDLPRPAAGEIRIFSVRGELYGILGGENYQAGRQEVIWNGRDRQGRSAPSGSYFARLYVDGRAIGTVTKMSLVR